MPHKLDFCNDVKGQISSAAIIFLGLMSVHLVTLNRSEQALSSSASSSVIRVLTPLVISSRGDSHFTSDLDKACHMLTFVGSSISLRSGHKLKYYLNQEI